MGWQRKAEWPCDDARGHRGGALRLQVLGVNPWVVIVPLVAVCGAALVWLDRRGM